MSVHADIALLAGSCVGIAAGVAHATHGWPLSLRVGLTRRLRGVPDRVRLMRCALCLSFWLAALAGLPWALLTLDPRPALAPGLAAAIAWAVLRFSARPGP